jgi:hypothetical protein
MLNQNQSNSINRLKLLIVLPFLGVFLLGFNTKEVVKFSEETKSTILTTEQQPDFKSPLKQEDIERVTFGYGETSTTAGVKFHNGIDLVGKAGKSVMASADGVVKTATQSKENGNYIVIDHSDGYSTKYLHLKDRKVTAGERVNSGKTIGHVGNTGKSTGPHLHFEILRSGKTLNPASFIPFKEKNNIIVTEKNNPPKKTSYSKTLKTTELKIDKNTTNESLEKMKRDLGKDGADFSYTVVRNSNKEIIDISIQITGTGIDGKNFNGNYNTSSDTPINPITILYDDESNAVSFWNSKPKNTRIKVISGDNKDDEDGAIYIFENKKENNQKIKIRVSDDDESDTTTPIYYLDGKKIKQNELAEISPKKIKSVNVLKGTSAKEKYGDKGLNGVVEITSKSDKKKIIINSSNDIQIEKDDNVFIIETDKANDFDGDIKFVTKGSKPLYVVDGKQIKKLKNTNTDKIESINVLKGEAARKKYGKKGKNGVVEIITKKEE